MAHLLFGSPAPPRSKQVGVGLVLAEKPEGLAITAVLPSGAAGRDGRVALGDLLTHIDGEAVRSIRSAKVLMMGDPGTYVDVTLLREGRPLQLSIWRPADADAASGPATPARQAASPGGDGGAAAAAAKSKRIEDETAALAASLRSGQALSAKKAEPAPASQAGRQSPARAAPAPDAAAQGAREAEGRRTEDEQQRRRAQRPREPEGARPSDTAGDVLALAARKQLEARQAAALAASALASSAAARPSAATATAHDTTAHSADVESSHKAASYYLDSPALASQAALQRRDLASPLLGSAPMKQQTDRAIVRAAHPHICNALSNELRRIRVRGRTFSQLTAEAALRLGQCQQVLMYLRDQTQLSNSDILVELRSTRLQVLAHARVRVRRQHAAWLHPRARAQDPIPLPPH